MSKMTTASHFDQKPTGMQVNFSSQLSGTFAFEDHFF
jgi:hypothetical protein